MRACTLFAASWVLTCSSLLNAQSQPATATAPSTASAASQEALNLREDTLLTDQDSPAGDVLWQMLASVVIILAIGGGSLLLIKKVLPRLGLVGPLRLAARAKQINVLETTRLGPGRSIHIIEVGQRRLLLGETANAINLVADLTEPATPAEPEDQS